MTMNADQQGFDGEPAWDAPGARTAFVRWTARHAAKALWWIALWWAALYVTILLPVWAAWPMALVLTVIGIVACVALGRLALGWRVRRILRVYPWRRRPGAVRITRGRDAVFTLPDPDNPEKSVSLRVTAGLFRALSMQTMKAYDEELWYAGDPRFACVMSESGRRGLSYLAQPTAYHGRTSPRRKGLSPEARRRARAIRARVGD